MDFKTGIEIQMRENLSMQMKTMLPLIERMNQQTKVLQQQWEASKGTKEENKQLALMQKHLRSIGVANKSLLQTNGYLTKIGHSAQQANRHMGMLGSGMGGIIGQLKGWAAAYIGFSEVVSGVKEGLKFEAEMNALKLSGFKDKDLKQAQAEAFRIGGSGMTTSAAEALNMMRFASAFTGSPQGGIEIADTGAKFDLAMRKLGVVGSSEGHSAHTLFRIAEKLGAKDPKDVQNVAESLTKLEGMGRGMIPLQAFDTQLARTRIAKTMGDRDALFQELGHLILEYGSVFGGTSGGGTGGPGTMIAAFSKAFAAGTMTAGAIQKLDQLGLVQNRDKLMKTTGGKTITHHNLTTGQDEVIHIAGSGSALSSKNFTVSNLVGSDIAAKSQMQWIQQVLIPALERRDHMKPGSFYTLDKTQQTLKLLEVMPGLKNTVQDLITQLVVMRTQYENQVRNYNKAPGLEGIVGGGTATLTHVTELQKSWATFNDALFGNHKVINEENRLLGRMTNLLNGATKAMPGFIDAVDDLIKRLKLFSPDTVAPTVAGAAIGAVVGQPAAGAAGGFAVAQAANAATDKEYDVLTHHLKTYYKNHPNVPDNMPEIFKSHHMHKDWANDFRASHGGPVLVPPPPPYVPSMVDMDMAQQYKKLNMNPPAKPAVINQTLNFHPMSGMDHEKVAKSVANAVAPHLEKRNMRNMRMAANANSKSGGAIQSPAGYAGEGN